MAKPLDYDLVEATETFFMEELRYYVNKRIKKPTFNDYKYPFNEGSEVGFKIEKDRYSNPKRLAFIERYLRDTKP